MSRAFAIEEVTNMNNESRIVRVETVIQHLTEVLDRMEKRFDKLEGSLDKRFDKIDQRFEKNDDQFNKIHSEIKSFKFEICEKIDSERKYISHLMWTQFGFLFVMITAVLGVLAKTKGWI